MTPSLARIDHIPSLQLLRQVIYELQSATDLMTLRQVVSSYIHDQLGYEFVWLGLYDADHETLEGPYQNALDENIGSQSISVLAGDLFDQVLLTRRPAAIASLQEENRVGQWQKLAQSLEIQGAVLQSIRYQKNSLGVLLIGTSKWGVSPHQAESEQLAILANTIGCTLQYLQSTTTETSSSQATIASPDQSLSTLLQRLTQRSSWDLQLSDLAQAVSELAPISGLYMLDPDSGDFACQVMSHVQKKRVGRSRRPIHALSFHQNLSFFQSLECQSNLSIGDVTSNIGTSIPNALITFLGARAFLFQPIFIQQSLKGFWVLGHSEPMQWSLLDKETLANYARLMELIYPASSPNAQAMEPSEVDSLSRLSTCVLPSPLSDLEDWDKGMNNWFRSLTQQFHCQWSILLTYDPAISGYLPVKYHSAHRRAVFDRGTVFKALSQVDEKLLLRNDGAVELNNLQEDMRLVAWRDQLLSQGIQSILVTSLTQGTTLETLLLLGNTSVRSWNADESRDLQTLAHKLYHAQQKRDVHVKMLKERRLNQVFRQGLQIMQTTQSSQAFIEKAARILVNLFEVSGCGILLWPPGRQFAKVKASVSPGKDYFAVPVGAKVELGDPLIQLLVRPAYDEHTTLKAVQISSASLTEETQRWLFTQGNWSILGLPLQPQPKKPICGVLFLAHSDGIVLNEAEMETLSDFVRHMAWVLWSSHVTEAWRNNYSELHTAHWYQNKMLGFSYEHLLAQCSTPKDVTQVQAGSQKTLVDAIAETEQTVMRLYDYNSQFIPEMYLEMESITLVRLLRELLDRLEGTFATKQIWVQVHHLKQSNVALKSSKVHLMYILDEVLKAATVRSDVGGRIDVWCQMSHPEWLELSITDGGQLDRRFIRDLNLGHQRDRLKPSLVTEDIGQRLLACRTLVKHLGGKLEFQTLEDQRTLTRFTLPCVTT